MAKIDDSAATIWFTVSQATDLSVVGGKGANLGWPTLAGFVEPPGFVVGTIAYAVHIESIRLNISQVLASINSGSAVRSSAA